jgi:hypothetical protein
MHAGLARISPAKNNLIWLFIVRRDKRMQDAGRCAGRYPAAEHSYACSRVRMPTTSVPILEAARAYARIVLMIVNTVTQPVEN